MNGGEIYTMKVNIIIRMLPLAATLLAFTLVSNSSSIGQPHGNGQPQGNVAQSKLQRLSNLLFRSRSVLAVPFAIMGLACYVQSNILEAVPSECSPGCFFGRPVLENCSQYCANYHSVNRQAFFFCMASIAWVLKIIDALVIDALPLPQAPNAPMHLEIEAANAA